MTSATPDTVLAELQKVQAAMLDPLDVPRTWTTRQVDAYEARRAMLARTITGLRNPDLDKLLALLAECEERRALVMEKQAEIEQQIAAAQDWRTIRDGRERDREFDRQQTLTKQLEMLHDGRLLIAPGVCLEQLDVIDVRIAELQQRIAARRARFDAHLKAAETLLGETVTA